MVKSPFILLKYIFSSVLAKESKISCFLEVEEEKAYYLDPIRPKFLTSGPHAVFQGLNLCYFYKLNLSQPDH